MKLVTLDLVLEFLRREIKATRVNEVPLVL